jgi:hypothetical protein
MDHYSVTSQQSSRGKPSKACIVCGGTILWRRRLATNWDRLMHCSAACRRVSVARARTGQNGRVDAYDHVAAESVASAA